MADDALVQEFQARLQGYEDHVKQLEEDFDKKVREVVLPTFNAAKSALDQKGGYRAHLDSEVSGHVGPSISMSREADERAYTLTFSLSTRTSSALFLYRLGWWGESNLAKTERGKRGYPLNEINQRVVKEVLSEFFMADVIGSNYWLNL